MNTAPIRQPRLLVAIPCFNEAATIGTVVQSIPRDIPGLRRVDVLVIDDGSADQTDVIARKNGAIVVRHPHNRGLGHAFQTAVGYTVQHGYDFMVIIDGDGQFASADIPLLLAPVLRGETDMATGSRFIDKALIPDMPRAKLIGNHMMAFLISKLVNYRYYDVTCGFRCYSREALLRINLQGGFNCAQESFLDLSAKDIKIREIPIVVRYFAERKSRVAHNLVRYAINTALIIFRTYRDYFPLRFFCSLALAFAVPATLAAIGFFVHYFVAGEFRGYLFLGFTSAFFYGIAGMFLVLAIVTDMLDRIRTNQERILYLLKSGSARGETLGAKTQALERAAKPKIEAPFA